MHCHQKTIKQKIKVSGKGLHTGEKIDVVLSPMPVDSGLWFLRADQPDAQPVLAATENVSDTRLATTLGRGRNSVGTIEHLLAVLGGLGVNNLKVEVCGPETPIFDGSALPWVELLQNVGLQTFNSPRPCRRVRRPFEIIDGDAFVRVEPASTFSVDFTIDFPGFLKVQNRVFTFSEQAFVSEIAPARTFCLLSDVEKMQRNGKALGGGLDNAVVVSDQGVLNPEGLRFPDECVRHKILDFLGDLALAQTPILGRFTACKAGHALNQRFLAEMLAAPDYLEPLTPAAPARRSERVDREETFDYRPSLSALKQAWAH
ncbi:MAG: UDP-3-O-acyl-N-acetylglucosamine deacetylase [Deltaproteobacteria bacterium]|jgi:UDP-3-O-[3-hydroxymyristoyl] N-acetylglucosamine deacetylase|nr:UDP-3-O-acyl-N-acetylglucosamine deacetylase [Deltaproteobacteria bacterium]